jgi:hypothetical protein
MKVRENSIRGGLLPKSKLRNSDTPKGFAVRPCGSACLILRADLCYGWLMLNAFVGLIHRHQELGLQWLLPECREAHQWLFDYGQQRPTVAVWAVMDRGVAAEVVDLLAEGDGVAALRRVAGGATCMGPVLVGRADQEAI